MLLTGSLSSIIPDSPAKFGWRIRQLELDDFLRYLGIRRLIVIRYSSGRNTWGSHREIKRGMFHRITISQITDADFANESLLHEIAHAKQSEEWAAKTGRPFYRFYREEYKYAKGGWGKAYQDNRYEIEAREFASFSIVGGIRLTERGSNG